MGGGVSETLTGFHLVRQRTLARVVLIDQRANFGLGIAYSTPSYLHLLNVPTGKISSLPNQPEPFLNWRPDNYGPTATEKAFAPRAVVGRYIQSPLTSTSLLEQEIATVVDVRLQGSGWVLTLDNGCELRVELIVLAIGNFDPAPLPRITKAASDSALYHHSAWAGETYEELPSDAAVALIGTGLTGVDVMLRLRELGHRGGIIAVSRHGTFPTRHADHTPLSSSAIRLDNVVTGAIVTDTRGCNHQAGVDLVGI
ncbi:FAD/NAD(P)-binding protein [Granulicella sp. dw_53]|uniref:FAD/NAD(P)-binding protein n=1 Tax=Granulicella sp. dw_53 TaxID=2719792 RepID=UPI0021026A79|nr:FAD/NAD(P)-binding protein [Granulicella sp. dw_53]